MGMIIYSGPNCPRCKQLKAFYQDVGIPFEERELDAEAVTDCLCDCGEKIMELPVVRTAANWVFARDLFADGELNEMEARRIANED